MKNKIETLSVAKAIITFLTNKKTRGPGLRLIGTITAKFFIPQFQTLIGLRKRKVVNVDHELDSLIPFSAEYLSTYIGFTHLWIRSIFFLYGEFGREAYSDIIDFIKTMENLYKSGYSVYDSCQSTTTRPKAGRNIPLKIMHLADPHLHCVPSLHVMIVCFNHLKINSIINTLSEDPSLYTGEIEYIKKQAIEIISSVLFLKQHSVNCISAGLFALSSHCREFTDEYVYNVLTSLRDRNNTLIDRMEDITSYMKELYHHFQKESVILPDTKTVLVTFLNNYNQIGQ